MLIPNLFLTTMNVERRDWMKLKAKRKPQMKHETELRRLQDSIIDRRASLYNLIF